MSSDVVVDHDTSRAGRWLRQRRLRTALWIAVLEAILAAIAHNISQYTIIALALIFIPIHLIWGKDQGDTIRQLSWIAAASQAFAVLAVIFAHFLGFFVLLLAGIFAAVAVYLIIADRR